MKNSLRTAIFFLPVILGSHMVAGQMSVAGTNPFPAIPYAVRMVTGDFDHDGDIDVLYQNGNTSGVGWNYMQNGGNGTYTTIAASGSGLFSAGPFNGISFTQYASMYAIDYNKDGFVDLLDQQNGSGRLLVNNSGTFSVGTNPFPVTAASSRLCFADFNGDGAVDVLYQASNTSGAGWNYMQNNGSGTFTTTAASSGLFSSGPFAGVTFTQFMYMFAIDYDKDGDIDLLDQQNNSSRLLVNSAGSFATGTNPFPTLTFAVRISFGDFDSDGDVDALYQNGNVSGAGWNYMQNNANGTYTTIAASGTGTFSSGPFNGVTFTQYGVMFVIDYDKDGDLDIADQQNTSTRLLTQANTPPALSSSTPASGAMAVVRDANIVLQFNKTVSTGTGNIYIKRTSDNSIFETIPATGAAVTGGGSSTITVNPAGVLASNTGYYINFDNTAFRDASGAVFGALPAGSLAINAITSPTFLSFSTSAALLPLTLLSFTGTIVDGNTKLTWQTAAETSLNRFELEYSTDAIHYNIIYSVKATNQPGNAVYQYINASALPGRQYYRLGIDEISGEKSYSPVVVVNPGNQPGKIMLYPVPANNMVTVMVPPGKYQSLELLDINGHVLLQKNIGVTDQTILLPLQNYPEGTYYTRLSNQSETLTRKFIKH